MNEALQGPSAQMTLLRRARSEFERRLAGVRPDQLPRPTPCTERTVRDLINHVVGESIMSERLLQGADAEEAVFGLDGDILGADASASFATAAAEYAAFEEYGATERTVHHPAMDMPGAQLLGFRIGGLTLHSWDLARAVPEATRPSTRSWSKQCGRSCRQWHRSWRRRGCSEPARAGRLVRMPRCSYAFWT